MVKGGAAEAVENLVIASEAKQGCTRQRRGSWSAAA
jgi:hypothetical protein